MDAQIIAEYGGIFTPLLLLAYIMWQVVKEVAKKDTPTHETLERGMAACEQRLQQGMSEIKREITEYKRDYKDMEANVTWLKDVHDRRDEYGLPIWYNKRSLENRIINLADTLESQTHSIDRLCNLLEDYAKRQQ